MMRIDSDQRLIPQTPVVRVPWTATLHLFGAFFCFFAIVAPMGHIPTDSLYSVETAKSLYYRHTMRIEPTEELPKAIKGVDGFHYSKYGVGYALTFLPQIALADLVHRIVGIDRLLAERFLLSFTNTVYGALIVVVLFLLLVRLGYRIPVSLTTVTLIAFGSILLPYAKIVHSETPVTLLLALFMLVVARNRRFDWRTGVAVGAIISGLYLVKFANVIHVAPIGFFVLYQVVRKQVTPAGLIAVAVMVVLPLPALLMGNAARFGNMLDFGYGAQQSLFTTPLLHGLSGLLLSPAKSAFIYSPFLIPGLIFLPGLFRRNGAVAVFLVVEAVVITLFYARYDTWHGGWCWGPRYLVPVMVLLHIPVASFIAMGVVNRVARVCCGLLLIPAICIQVLGATINYQQISAILPDPTATGAPYIPVAATFFAHKVSCLDERYAFGEFPVDKEVVGQGSFVAPAGGDTLVFDNRETFQGLNVMWIGLPRLYGWHRMLLVPVALMIAGMFLLWRMIRILARQALPSANNQVLTSRRDPSEQAFKRTQE